MTGHNISLFFFSKTTPEHNNVKKSEKKLFVREQLTVDLFLYICCETEVNAYFH